MLNKVCIWGEKTRTFFAAPWYGFFSCASDYFTPTIVGLMCRGPEISISMKNIFAKYERAAVRGFQEMTRSIHTHTNAHNSHTTTQQQTTRTNVCFSMASTDKTREASSNVCLGTSYDWYQNIHYAIHSTTQRRRCESTKDMDQCWSAERTINTTNEIFGLWVSINVGFLSLKQLCCC